MKTIILTFFLAANLCAHSQKAVKATPIADETTLSESGEKNIKVKCSNEKITAMLLKKFQDIIVRYNVAYKKDRLGRYAEYTIVFPKENANQVTSFLKSI